MTVGNKHQDQKQLREETFILLYSSQSITRGSQNSNSKQSLRRDCGGTVLTGLLSTTQLDFLDNLGSPAQDGTAHKDLTLPCQTLMKKMLTGMSTSQFDGVNASVEVLSSQVTLVRVQLTLTRTTEPSST